MRTYLSTVHPSCIAATPRVGHLCRVHRLRHTGCVSGMVSTAHAPQVFYLKERYGWFTAQCTAADSTPNDELEAPIDERRPLLNDG